MAMMERVRGNERGAQIKNLGGWTDVERVFDLPDGYYIARIKDPRDCKILGKMMGHCSAAHWPWVVQELTYFFSVFDKENICHNTIHCKDVEWLHKQNQEMEAQVNKLFKRFKEAGIMTEKGNGWPPGYHVSQTAYDNRRGPKFVNRAKTFDLAIADQESRVRYWTREYEQAKRYALSSGALGPNNPYKGTMDYANREKAKAEQKLNELKALAEVNKNKKFKPYGAIGRRFKYDGKTLIVLSASAKGYSEDAEKYTEMASWWIDSLDNVTPRADGSTGPPGAKPSRTYKRDKSGRFVATKT